MSERFFEGTFPQVERVEAYEMRRPELAENGYGGGVVLGVFTCRIGPFVIVGARLVKPRNASMQVLMPRCTSPTSRFFLWDADVRRALKAAAKRAYAAMLEAEGHG